MKIRTIGKSVFYFLLLSGIVCLFGYILTNEIIYAVFGFYLLFIGTIISLMVMLGLAIYGILYEGNWKNIGIACLFMLANLPIAALFAYIGTSII